MIWRRLTDFRGSFGPLGSFDGITDIVVKHEGLVDKIIGNARACTVQCAVRSDRTLMASTWPAGSNAMLAVSEAALEALESDEQAFASHGEISRAIRTPAI